MAVALKVKGKACATGAAVERRRSQPSRPRDNKKPYDGAVVTTVGIGAPSLNLGVVPKPVTPKTHFLEGWRGKI
jgi:hypothetical protein